MFNILRNDCFVSMYVLSDIIIIDLIISTTLGKVGSYK